jgi:hypothetical protein
MTFVVLSFVSLVALKEVVRVLKWAGLSQVSLWFGAHVLSAAFLIGIVAGQFPVDSRLTGEKWFRSKDGTTYEGFKLDQLRRWTWMLILPLFVLGAVLWCLGQDPSGFSFSAFYHGFLMPNCSEVWARKEWFNDSCNIHLIFVVPWIASIGYSLGPAIGTYTCKLAGSLHSTHEPSVSLDKN